MEKFINNAPFALVLVCLIIGFVLLIKGADFFVEGSSSVAKRLHVPSIIIGLTIVAMGTSLPETAVSVSASITGNNELAVSNVVGSNIFNLMVVIGVCAMIATVDVMPIPQSATKRLLEQKDSKIARLQRQQSNSRVGKMDFHSELSTTLRMDKKNLEQALFVLQK